MATALIASTLLTGGFAPAAAFAGTLAGAAFGGAALATTLGAGFFGGGAFAFPFAAVFAAAAVFDAITVLCAASRAADSEKGQRKRHPNESTAGSLRRAH